MQSLGLHHFMLCWSNISVGLSKSCGSKIFKRSNFLWEKATTWHSTNPDPPQPSIKTLKQCLTIQGYHFTKPVQCSVSVKFRYQSLAAAGLSKLHIACKRILLRAQSSKIKAKHIFKCKKIFWQYFLLTAHCPFFLAQHYLW